MVNTPIIERISCAAIWYMELPTSYFKPINIDKGVVICGHRHGDCISIIVATMKLRTVTYADDGVGQHKQGFLTNMNRFVDRKEAMKIALDNGQTKEENLNNPRVGLFSEDIY